MHRTVISSVAINVQYQSGGQEEMGRKRLVRQDYGQATGVLESVFLHHVWVGCVEDGGGEVFSGREPSCLTDLAFRQCHTRRIKVTDRPYAPVWWRSELATLLLIYCFHFVCLIMARPVNAAPFTDPIPGRERMNLSKRECNPAECDFDDVIWTGYWKI